MKIPESGIRTAQSGGTGVVIRFWILDFGFWILD
jgi:hypothetical protein